MSELAQACGDSTELSQNTYRRIGSGLTSEKSASPDSVIVVFHLTRNLHANVLSLGAGRYD